MGSRQSAKSLHKNLLSDPAHQRPHQKQTIFSQNLRNQVVKSVSNYRWRRHRYLSTTTDNRIPFAIFGFLPFSEIHIKGQTDENPHKDMIIIV